MIKFPSARSTNTVAIGIPGRGEFAVRRCRFAFPRSAEPTTTGVPTYDSKVPIAGTTGPLFAEIKIVQIANEQGYDAVWLDTFHQNRRWAAMPGASQPVSLPPEQQDLLDRIAHRRGMLDGKRAGHHGAWDVFAWKGSEVAFVESKGTDALRAAQQTWLGAAVDAGVPLSSFTLFQWTATKPNEALRAAASHR